MNAISLDNEEKVMRTKLHEQEQAVLQLQCKIDLLQLDNQGVRSKLPRSQHDHSSANATRTVFVERHTHS